MKSSQAISSSICNCILLCLFTVLSANAQGDSWPATKSLAISEENAALLNRHQEYPNLEKLEISCLESLSSLPTSIGTLAKLKELIIDNGNGCSMNPELPESIGNLHALEKLVLFGAQDARPIGKDYGPQPRDHHRFPKSMSQLTNLTYLDLGRNGFEEIPEFVKDLPNLREFGFAWNEKVKALPPFLVGLRKLQTLRLDADGLTDLPGFLNQLPKLSRITLGDNCKITQNATKTKTLQRRFPKISLDFNDEYDCPAK